MTQRLYEQRIMLSLGNLAVGQAAYYLDQAQGPTSRASAVASGVEDYYLAGQEAPGVWMGAGAAALGLRGQVAAGPLDRVLAGEHPATGEPLGRVLSARRPGFDLTISAPKSVSVLFGVGDDELRAEIQAAHESAVADAMGYMERHAAVTRRGQVGVHAIVGIGLVAAAFLHRTSRAGDPQLHTHVLVANLTLGADGRWSTLDGRRIYAHAKTAGYLYEARLRAELTRQLGFEWGPVRNGIADVGGMPPAVLRAFSRRRADIEAELERRGASSARAADIAALQTRRGKDYDVAPEQLVPEWRERAAQLGLTREVIRELGGRARPISLTFEMVERIADELAGPDGLTARRSTFMRRDVVQGFSERLPAAANLTTADVERIADTFLRSPRAVVLAEGERREPLRLRDGRVVRAAAIERTYSTPQLLALERRILHHAVGGLELRMIRARPYMIERALDRRPSLSGEQVTMVRRLTEGSGPVAVVVGQAGSGKTFALGAARDAWEDSGRHVYGAALARRAARELEDTAGIPSTSVAALLDALERRPNSTLRPRSVLVLDEAAMVPTRDLARLVEHASRLQVKLVLVGDDRQLPAIQAGGAFRALGARLPVIELTENRRQTQAWERDALALIRDGNPSEAVDRYERADRIAAGDDAHELKRRLVADWWDAGDVDGALMIAQRRKDVAELNRLAHALMRTVDSLGPEEVTVGRAAFAVGDRAVVRRNDRGLGVVNGDRGTVVHVDRERGRIELELAGRRVMLDRAYLDRSTRHGVPALQHGYAITGHLAQGLTCQQTFILATDQLTREAGYVALSRGRQANRVYALRPAEPERDEFAPSDGRAAGARDALIERLGRSQAQTLATDHARPASRLTTELAEVMRERQDLEGNLNRAVAERWRLEREPPGRMRRKARARHATSLGQAVAGQDRIQERLDAGRKRENALRERLAEERPTLPRRLDLDRVPERPRPLFRDLRRDIGLER